MTTQTAKTPGYNCRLTIFFAATKSGKPRAYYWSAWQLRAFPLPLAEAEIMRASETADVICCHPLRPCTHKEG